MILSGGLGRLIEDYQALQTGASKGSVRAGRDERRSILWVRKDELMVNYHLIILNYQLWL